MLAKSEYRFRFVPRRTFSIVKVEGLSPVTPQNAEGQRIEPLASVPKAAGTIRAARMAPLPPLLPPGMRVGSWGLRTAPKESLCGDAWCIRPSSTVISGSVGMLLKTRVTISDRNGSESASSRWR